MAKTITVEFAEFPGDEYVVRISPVPLDDLFAITDSLSRWNTRAGLEELRDRFGAFIETLPPPIESAGGVDVNVLVALVREWRKGVSELPLPLLATSSDSGPSEDESR